MSEYAPGIELRGVSAGYNGQPIVHDIDLTVSHGEIVALFGANGAGKTTTLLTIAGEVQPLRGQVLIHGSAQTQSLYQAAKGGLALLTDDRAIFAPLSVRDNLRLGRGSVESALEFFPELEPHLNRRAGLLSGGQQQMLSLGRILASEPKVILADELSLGLAPLVVRRLLEALRAAALSGVAVLLVEQHVPVALEFADRACVLTQGRIALTSPVADIDPDTISELYLSAG
jgi:branched-chain amino acid transport system ATP-binding protein